MKFSKKATLQQKKEYCIELFKNHIFSFNILYFILTTILKHLIICLFDILKLSFSIISYIVIFLNYSVLFFFSVSPFNILLQVTNFLVYFTIVLKLKYFFIFLCLFYVQKLTDILAGYNKQKDVRFWCIYIKVLIIIYV